MWALDISFFPHIRASVYKDGAGQISRDPRTKRLKLSENDFLGLHNSLRAYYIYPKPS